MKPYKELEDMALILQVRKGDTQAFSEIVRRYKTIVARTVQSMLGRSQEAEDVGQETFIRFYKSISSFKGESKLSTYLVRIAINLSLNELKKRKKHFDLFIDKDEQRIKEIPSDEESFNSMVTKEEIEKALLQLEDKFREVITLRLVEGYSVKETAEILNIPVGTVLSRLSRAQLKLRNLLKNETIKNIK